MHPTHTDTRQCASIHRTTNPTASPITITVSINTYTNTLLRDMGAMKPTHTTHLLVVTLFYLIFTVHAVPQYPVISPSSSKNTEAAGTAVLDVMRNGNCTLGDIVDQGGLCVQAYNVGSSSTTTTTTTTTQTAENLMGNFPRSPSSTHTLTTTTYTSSATQSATQTSTRLTSSPVSTIPQSKCFNITKSFVCPDFNGISIQSTNSVNSTTSFDAFVLSHSANNTNEIRSYKNTFQCPDFNGGGVRYSVLLSCSYMVTHMSAACPQAMTIATNVPVSNPDKVSGPSQQFGAQYNTTSTISKSSIVSSSTPSSTPMQLKPFRNMCRDTCIQALQSILTTFHNTKVCSQSLAITQTSTRLSYMNVYNDFCQSLKIANKTMGDCLDGTHDIFAGNSCGFITIDQGRQYCMATPKDPCCVQMMRLGSVYMTVNMGNMTDTTKSTMMMTEINTDTATGTLFGIRKPVLYIVGGSVSGVVLIVLCFGIFMYRRRNGSMSPRTMFNNIDKRKPKTMDATVPGEDTVINGMRNTDIDSRIMSYVEERIQMPPPTFHSSTQNSYTGPDIHDDRYTMIGDLQHNSVSSLQIGSIVRIVATYDPAMPDELLVCVGDEVEVLGVWDDGWATGRNLSSQTEGVFPIACALGPSSSNNTKSNKKISSRMY